MVRNIIPLGIEKTFEEDELIVSRTDVKGRIQYCNRKFISLSGYSEKELLGQPHSIVRHPEMPRCIFNLLWKYISEGEEIFAYVKNLCKGGEYYWVFANITPTYDDGGQIIGYHSNRRKPTREALKTIIELYGLLLKEENKYQNRKEGMAHSLELLSDILAKKGMTYDEFILSF